MNTTPDENLQGKDLVWMLSFKYTLTVHLHWKGSGKASNSLLSIWAASLASSLFSELEILKASSFSFFHVIPFPPSLFPSFLPAFSINMRSWLLAGMWRSSGSFLCYEKWICPQILKAQLSKYPLLNSSSKHCFSPQNACEQWLENGALSYSITSPAICFSFCCQIQGYCCHMKQAPHFSIPRECLLLEKFLCGCIKLIF